MTIGWGVTGWLVPAGMAALAAFRLVWGPSEQRSFVLSVAISLVVVAIVVFAVAAI